MSAEEVEVLDARVGYKGLLSALRGGSPVRFASFDKIGDGEIARAVLAAIEPKYLPEGASALGPYRPDLRWDVSEDGIRLVADMTPGVFSFQLLHDEPPGPKEVSGVGASDITNAIPQVRSKLATGRYCAKDVRWIKIESEAESLYLKGETNHLSNIETWQIKVAVGLGSTEDDEPVIHIDDVSREYIPKMFSKREPQRLSVVANTREGAREAFRMATDIVAGDTKTGKGEPVFYVPTARWTTSDRGAKMVLDLEEGDVETRPRRQRDFGINCDPNATSGGGTQGSGDAIKMMESQRPESTVLYAYGWNSATLLAKACHWAVSEGGYKVVQTKWELDSKGEEARVEAHLERVDQ